MKKKGRQIFAYALAMSMIFQQSAVTTLAEEVSAETEAVYTSNEEEIPEVTQEAETPQEAEESEGTGDSEATETPEITQPPEVTEIPEITENPEISEAPEVTEKPENPEVTQIPEVSETPDLTVTPSVTPSVTPEVSPAPEESNPEADVETAADWEATIPALTGKWGEDLATVATSQIGYTESLLNFTMENDVKKGYTRYGVWAGSPYSDWNTLFAMFSIHYAGIPDGQIPWSANADEWVNILVNSNMLMKEGYEAKAGDLVFYQNENGTRVGIIRYTEPGILHVVTGDQNDSVAEEILYTDGGNIIGYVDVTTAFRKYTGDTRITLEQELDNATVTAEFELGVLPEDAVLDVQFYDPEEHTEIADVYDAVLEENVTGEELAAETEKEDSSEEETTRLMASRKYFSVAFEKGEEKIQPEGPVSIGIQFHEPQAGDEVDNSEKLPVEVEGEDIKVKDLAENTQWKLFSLGENGETKDLTQAQTTMLSVDGEENLTEVGFETDDMEMYGLVNGTEVSDWVALQKALESGNNVILKDDIIVPATAPEEANGDRAWIEIQGTVELDLAGHSLTIQNPEGGARENEVFKVFNGGNFTVSDSGAGTGTHTVTYQMMNVSGTSAPSQITGSYTGGVIQGSKRNVFNVEGGSTLTIEGGCIYDNGTVGDGFDGGAVKISGNSTLNLEAGAVLAKNKGSWGGAVNAYNSTININGAIIAENEALRRGGGIFANGGNNGESKVYLNYGYVTCNTANETGVNNTADGGGGIRLDGGSDLYMSGGYVTGNHSLVGGGGGIRAGFYDYNSSTMEISITGGYISGNTSGCEGCGLSVGASGSASISGNVYVTYNTMSDSPHWGGGGIFCADGATMRIENLLVTGNHAGGFGGGLAGCSTGRVFSFGTENGAAIFDNTADGVNMSGAVSSKDADRLYANANEVFRISGYQDYFSALNSIVGNAMLGGGVENWTGSADGVQVSTTEPTDLLAAAYQMGLTSQASDADKSAAAAKATVVVMGNSSYTHGGGILCNGILVIGSVPEDREIVMPDRLEVQGFKEVISQLSGEQIQHPEDTFEFVISKEDETATEGRRVIKKIKSSTVHEKNESGNEVETLLGSLNFVLPFEGEGIQSAGEKATVTYYLSEKAAENYQFNSTEFKFDVTGERQDSSITVAGAAVKQIRYVITEITVSRRHYDAESKGWTDWEVLDESEYSFSPASNDAHGAQLKLGSKKTPVYTNIYADVVTISGEKTWVDGENAEQTRPEKIIVKVMNGTTVAASEVVSADDNWKYTFTDLPKYGADNNVIQYTVEEEPVKDYKTEVDGTNITNTLLTDISGQKTWSDNGNAPKRPSEITVKLMNGNTEVASQNVMADNNWIYTFKNLPKYNEKGEIPYKVVEVAVEGYTPVYTKDSYDINNTRDLGSLKLTKTTEGAATPSDTVFTITNEDQTITKTVKYSEFDKDGTYTFTGLPTGTYTVTETGAEVTGYTLVVEANQTAEVKKDTETTVAFVNKYTQDLGSLKLTKTTEGAATPSDTVFTITNEDQTITKTVKYSEFNEDGTYTFTDLPTGNYTVTETNGDLENYTHVVIGNGQTIEIGKDENKEATIENYYLQDEIILGATKVYNKDLTGGEFEFTLREVKEDGSAIEDAYQETVKNKEHGVVEFSSITYKEAGDHYYQITENHGGETINGITYDKTVYTVHVTVEEKDHVLLATADLSAEDVKFTNIYAATGSIQLKAQKTMKESGDKLGIFEFQIKDSDGKVLQTVSNDADGVITFEKMDYTLEDVGKTFTYTVNESIPETEGKENTEGIIYVYDHTIYTVTVEVSDHGDGMLDIVKKINDKEYTDTAIHFENDIVKDKSASIEVTKELKLNNNPLNAVDRTFYVALFEDKECTRQVAEPKAITFKNASSSTVEFTGLEVNKTYYVRETDVNGKVIETGTLEDGTAFVPYYPNGDNVTVKIAGGKEVLVFKNQFTEWPDGFYLEAKLNITKKLLGADGKAVSGNETFYAGIFDDKECTKKTAKTEQNIIPLALDGNSEVTVSVIAKLSKGESYQLYIAEVDNDGNLVDSDSGFAYDATVENENVTLNEQNTSANITIINQKYEEVTPTVTPAEVTPAEVTPTEVTSTEITGTSTGVKTGDTTPIALYVMLLLVAAAAVAVSCRRRKEK